MTTLIFWISVTYHPGLVACRQPTSQLGLLTGHRTWPTESNGQESTSWSDHLYASISRTSQLRITLDMITFVHLSPVILNWDYSSLCLQAAQSTNWPHSLPHSVWQPAASVVFERCATPPLRTTRLNTCEKVYMILHIDIQGDDPDSNTHPAKTIYNILSSLIFLCATWTYNELMIGGHNCRKLFLAWSFHRAATFKDLGSLHLVTRQSILLCCLPFVTDALKQHKAFLTQNDRIHSDSENS